jgi:hypothetical protein
MMREALFMFMFYLPRVIEGNVSVGRISDFLSDVRSVFIMPDVASDVSHRPSCWIGTPTRTSSRMLLHFTRRR